MALEQARDTADAVPQLPDDESDLILRLVEETAHLVRMGQEG